MAEISDAELAELHQSRNLLKSLYDDSAVGFDFRRMVKKKYPNASIPELQAIETSEKLGADLSKKIEETQATYNKRIDDFLAAQTKKDEDSKVEAYEQKFNAIIKDRGYTEDGKKALITLMKDRGIQDPEDAAVIFESRQPKAAPTPRSHSTRMPFVSPSGKDDESYQRLMQDPDQWMADELLNDSTISAQEE